MAGWMSWLDESGNEKRASSACNVWSAEAIARLHDAEVKRLLADGLAVRAPDGLAGAMEPIRALGNGQVPDVAALAWRLLTGSLIRKDNEAAMSIPDAA